MMPQLFSRRPGLLGTWLAFGLGLGLAWVGLPRVGAMAQNPYPDDDARGGPSRAAVAAQDDPGPPPPDGPPPRNGRRPPPPPPRDRLMVALDKDHDGELSADEIKSAAQSLKAVDGNHDGKLTRNELFPPRPPRPDGPGPDGPGPDSPRRRPGRGPEGPVRVTTRRRPARTAPTTAGRPLPPGPRPRRRTLSCTSSTRTTTA